MIDDANRQRIRLLIDACHRSARTYLRYSRRSPRPELGKFLEIHANGCLDAAQSLAALVGEQTGPATIDDLVDGLGTEPGIDAIDEVELLEACEAAADEALDLYDDALRAGLSPSAHGLVASQHEGAQRTHDQIRALRDRALADREAGSRDAAAGL
jgi:hypothetical protein